MTAQFIIILRTFAFLFSLCFSCVSTWSQNFPIRVNTSISAPYPIYLTDYYNADQKITVQVLPLDKSIENFKVKLHMTIEGKNIRLETSKNYRPQPIYLTANEPLIFTGTDFSELFNINNLDLTGISREDYQLGGKLPEGIYTFTFEVLDYNRSSIVSNKGFAVAWLVLSEPPLLNTPQSGTKIRQTAVQNIVFQWMPRNTGSPNSSASTNYIFRLYEINAEGVSPDFIVNSTKPIYETTVDGSTFIYGPDATELILGKKYAYYIQAKDINGRDLFRNEGKSEVREFTYGEECRIPQNLKATETRGPGISLQWQQDYVHTSFDIEIGQVDENNVDWISQTATSTRLKIFDNIAQGKTYKCRVRANCFNYDSKWSQDVSLTLSEVKISPPFKCTGLNDLKLPSNTKLITTIKIGDIITVGGYKAKIISVSVAGNTFSGEALVEVPFFGGAKVKHKFSNVKINELKEVIDGKFISAQTEGTNTFTTTMNDVWNNVQNAASDVVDETIQ